MKKFKPKNVLRLMLASAAVISVVTLMVQGLRLPWSEEGALFALYGFGVGFATAILCSMALLWVFIHKK